MLAPPSCDHLVGLTAADFPAPRTPGACEDCIAEGTTWVHLRECQECGHVGCCDNSRRRHATAHYRQTTHPVIRSLEPDENWDWCYVDEVAAELAT